MSVGLLLGWFLSALGLGLLYLFDWNWRYAHFIGRIPNSVATIFTSFAYISGVMLCIQNEYLKAVQVKLTALGKVALTGYLMQSILATTIFYGYGLGWFGYIGRAQQLLIMFGIWLLLLYAASIWNKSYRFGPFEWIWRCLTYLRWIPINTHK